MHTRSVVIYSDMYMDGMKNSELKFYETIWMKMNLWSFMHHIIYLFFIYFFLNGARQRKNL